MKCKHNYINTEDGTHDLICTKCNKRAQQAFLKIDPMKNTISKEINKSEINITIDVNSKDTFDVDTIIEEISRKLILEKQQYGG